MKQNTLIIVTIFILLLSCNLPKNDSFLASIKNTKSIESSSGPVSIFNPSAVDFSGFSKLVLQSEQMRSKRLISLDTFLAFAKEHNTMILDTRSEAMFKSKHLKGAIHLNFSDFSESKLRKLIPDKTTRILIYCNNNFFGDEINFALKSQPLALNIPTYINLVGYGYTNVYELSDMHNVGDDQLVFEGTSTKETIK